METKVCKVEKVGEVIRFFGENENKIKIKCFFTNKLNKENILLPFTESGLQIPPQELVILDILNLKRYGKIRVLFSPYLLFSPENDFIRYRDSNFLISTVRPAIALVGLVREGYLPIGIYMKIDNYEDGLWGAGIIKESNLDDLEMILMIFSNFYDELVKMERVVMIGPTPNHLKNNLKKLESIITKSLGDNIDVYVADNEVEKDEEFVSIYYFK